MIVFDLQRGGRAFDRNKGKSVYRIELQPRLSQIILENLVIIIIQLMYVPYERQKSRQRSRDRERKYHGRSPSEDSNDYRKQKHQYRDSKSKSKRVKFEENADIKVFRKEDEPSAKGLTEEEIGKLKAELEKEIAKNYDFNWEHFKHRDALSQSNSMREQRERERVLNEKLMSAKQLIGYVCPAWLRKDQKSLADWGVDSLQRQAHTARIHDILGCYYTHLSEIPNQPQFQILNTNTTTESKLIKFDNDTLAPDTTYQPARKTTEQKPIKGILKTPLSPHEKPPLEPKNISPNLILLLKDLKQNPTIYSKEKTEQLLKPYRDSGELEYLTKNKDVLEMMLRNLASQPPPPVKQPFTPSVSAGRQSHERHSQPQNYPPMGGYTHPFVPKADKYRTVPCKYYHSHLGCNKVDNCTYIHDERYKGVSVPPNYIPPTQSKMPATYQQPSQGPYKDYPPANISVHPGMQSSMPHGYPMGGTLPYGNQRYYPSPDRANIGSYPGGPSGGYSGATTSSYPGGGSGGYQGGSYSGPSGGNYPDRGYGSNVGGPYSGQGGRNYGDKSVGGMYGRYPGQPYVGPYPPNNYGNPPGYYYSQGQGGQGNQKN